MEVLLTGGAGYIGSHCAVELLNSGYDVVIADNLINSSKKAIERIREITGKDLKFYQIDVCDRQELDRLFRENDIGCVIHFAGLKAVGESVSVPLRYYRNNLDSTLSLLEAMKDNGVSNLIFSSSATVYGENNPIPFLENMQTGGCSNPYGWTKYMIEQILIDEAKADKNLSVVLLRYFNPVGAHPSGLIGEDPSGIPNNLMPYIAQTAVGKREKLTVFGDDYETPDGTCQRDYIHIMDLAAGHVAAVDYVVNHKGTEVFNLGTGNPVSVLEMVTAFEKANGLKLNWQFGPRRPGDIPVSYANADKALKVLGWRATRTVEDMCRDTYRWQTKNPNGYGE